MRDDVTLGSSIPKMTRRDGAVTASTFGQPFARHSETRRITTMALVSIVVFPVFCESQLASPAVNADCMTAMLPYGGGRQMTGFPNASPRILQPARPMDAESGRIA
ncbi:hypothetical protein MN608_03569 [Microdochium nivale]|nr:hypothetical protein MN608_03569 [Microdochium nivale]